MIVEVRGVRFLNKGAELMMCAVRDQVRSWSPENVIALNLRAGSFRQRREAGLAHVVRFDAFKLARLERPVMASGRLIPRALRRASSLVLDAEVDVVMDASGFAYGDAWGPQPATRALLLAKRAARRGKPYIVLPQAFGPFEGAELRREMAAFVDRAALVFARDPRSYEYVASVAPRTDHLYLAPDFTNLLEPAVGPPRLDGHVVVVPNRRMVEMASGHDRDAYLHLLATLLVRARDLGFPTSIVVHDLRDQALAQQLRDAVGGETQVLAESDPLRLKAALSQPALVVASRFHALVSALSQATPAIGTSWSHKYRMLFEDYGSVDCLLGKDADPADAASLLERELEPQARERRRTLLGEHATREKQRTRRMWDQVRVVLGS